jgi:hypothetical protein
MTRLSETTLDEGTTPRKKAVRIRAARLDGAPPCADGEDLKQQYDSALQQWKRLCIPPGDLLEKGEIAALMASQLKEEALTKRNVAANRMYVHRATCSICRRRR